jgi:Fur family transcriptional regulator, ferric uptake regulator
MTRSRGGAGQGSRAKAAAKISSASQGHRELIRTKGLRATAPRIAVYDHLSRLATPVSHGDIAAELAGEGWDRATVYRNLIDLTEAGLVRRSDLGDHVWRFELVRGRHAASGHPHFMCESCGDVQCLPDHAVEIKASRGAPRALRRKGIQIQLKGRCDRCVAP